MASVLNTLFQRYRNNNRNTPINPQVQQNIKKGSIDKIGPEAYKRNPNIGIFNNAKNNIAEIIDKRSVISQYSTNINLPNFDAEFAGINAIPVESNKIERLRQYRSMAMYPECDFCLNEIANDVLNEDEQNEFIHLNISKNNTTLDEDQKSVLQAEFKRFIELFNFRDDMYKYVKWMLTDGEIAFENIINKDKPKLGIIGVKYLRTEYYDTIIDKDTGFPIGITFDKEQMQEDIKNILSNGCFGARSLFNNMVTAQMTNRIDDTNKIPILYPQLTYISSGEMSRDGLINYPLIEKCKQAYHQFALMMDSAVILRVTRAPERLLFNIDVSGMAPKLAESKIREFVEKLKSKKIVSARNQRTVDGSINGEPQVDSVYDPVSMLESYYFGKTNASDGTSVESVGSNADYEQIADIEFFLRRLFKQFTVPFSRYKTPETNLERDDAITYEESSMARQTMRIQRRFAQGLKRSYITDLKLRGLWEQYELKESDINISFVPPALYEIYQAQKLLTAKIDTYKTIVDNEEFSKITAMKTILKMSDEDIENNFRNLIKEKQMIALADYYADKISDENRPVDYESPIRLSGEEKKDEENSEETSGSSEEAGAPDSETPETSDNQPEAEEEAGKPSFGLGN